jgi:hypothetical protein
VTNKKISALDPGGAVQKGDTGIIVRGGQNLRVYFGSAAGADTGAFLSDTGFALSDTGFALSDTGFALSDTGFALSDTGQFLSDSGAFFSDTNELLADMVALPLEVGDILYRDTGSIKRLDGGDTGYVLKAQGPAAPIWAAESAASGGELVNRWYGEYATYSSHTTTVPLDDTIPQNTEGTQILAVTTDTLASASNRLRVTVHMPINTNSTLNNNFLMLFRDSVANALQVSIKTMPAAAYHEPMTLQYEYAPGATTAVAFKVRVGVDGGTGYINGNSSGRLMGGAAKVTMVVEEVKP